MSANLITLDNMNMLNGTWKIQLLSPLMPNNVRVNEGQNLSSTLVFNSNHVENLKTTDNTPTTNVPTTLNTSFKYSPRDTLDNDDKTSFHRRQIFQTYTITTTTILNHYSFDMSAPSTTSEIDVVIKLFVTSQTMQNFINVNRQ